MSLFFNLKLLLPVLLLCHASSAEEKTKIDIRPPGSEGQRQGLYWFGPRLGKRSVDDRKQTLVNLFEAADTLKYYYDQLPSYETPDEQENKGWKIFFTPKLGRSLNNVYQDEKRFENVEFTPRLGRRLPEDYRVTQPDQEVYKPDPDQIDRRAKFFSPRLGRSGSVNFSPRLGRNIAYDLFPENVRMTRSINDTKST